MNKVVYYLIAFLTFLASYSYFSGGGVLSSEKPSGVVMIENQKWLTKSYDLCTGAVWFTLLGKGFGDELVFLHKRNIRDGITTVYFTNGSTTIHEATCDKNGRVLTL